MTRIDEAILNIKNLTVAYRQGDHWLQAVRDVSLAVPAGQTCGVVGESGSGKSTLGLAIMRYLPEAGMICKGTIAFDGRNLLDLGTAEMREIWGAKIALVPQDPLSSLNPTLKLGEQVAEILRRHCDVSGQGARDRARELFEQVRLGDPERVAESYPHQISGGMLQRVLIAMALSTEPKLLILDEPTTSLDVTTQAAVLDLLRELIKGRQTAVLYITHNLGVVAQVCDRVVVLYASEFVEDAPARRLFRKPLHPYTQGLLDSVPRLGENKRTALLRPIEGRIPDLDELPTGCIFRPRCPLAIEICEEHPPLYDAGEQRWSRCHRWDEIKRGEVDAHRPPPQMAHVAEVEQDSGNVLEVEEVKVYFSEKRSLLDVVKREEPEPVRAVNGVSLTIPRGRTLGLVGESGSGKTTLARAIVGLVERTAGTIELLDTELSPTLQGRDREVQRELQIVFQNPQEALNPYMSVNEALRRPLIRLSGLSGKDADAKVDDLLAAVHLSGEYTRRLPGEMSGGEKQRIAVARAYAPNPALLVADEPVTSLDVSVQASIVNLLSELQAEHGISILFISHDLAVVGYLADIIAVIYAGHLMEVGPAAATFDPPYHPYTEALLASVPLIDPDAQQVTIRLEGEVPNPSEEISGCPFHTRCPRFLGDVCVEEVPPWREDEATGKRIFCHIPLEELREKQHRPFAFSNGKEEEN